MLNVSAELVAELGRPDLALTMRKALEGPMLAKPLDHRGPAETDMFQLSMLPEQRIEVLALVRQAQENPPKVVSKRGMGGFVEAWQEFVSCSS